ncbi:hypothetical protein FH972_019654 [Carpinus fangiana]|uniref:RanBP2-type domain-containing protein n=1 Tax=Carpinus fangiana TaxID=176857 RepID=A0A5N6RUB5_9ROSI|nr:hypothetical protein FH972_019654 [Carpinus fangiana]
MLKFIHFLRTPTPISPLLFRKPFSPKPLRFLRYSSSAAVDTLTADAAETLCASHPWPEWVNFVDRLKSKGYFVESPPEANHEGDAESAYNDMNLVKDACFSFARDRYDVFKSLSTEDIQTVVEGGCPNLLRKAVNSAKRLRAYVRLDEGDVCSTCTLRGSCDRAYVILKENDAAARTVDIVRILLFYALDPLVISGGEKPPGRDIIESSARKLFSELIALSETSPDPVLPKPAVKGPKRKEDHIKFMDDKLSQDVEMKRGDWMCPKCNFMNFARNLQCRKCNEYGPKGVGLGGVEMKKGDWTCPECNFMNFSRNIRCLECKAEGPKRVSVDEAEMKKGDWTCPQCGFMNFASNRKCLRCPELRPKRELRPGDWECLSCGFLNYSRNMECLKCKGERPKETVASEYKDQLWKQPRY